MIIDDFDISGARRSVRPFEAYPPLIVYTDAILARPITTQCLKPVTWQRTQIGKTLGGFQPIEPGFGLSRETGKLSNTFTKRKALRASVPVADDHKPKCSARIAFFAAPMGEV
jgi:hypothetical protein